jgi:hypothetical protein
MYKNLAEARRNKSCLPHFDCCVAAALGRYRQQKKRQFGFAEQSFGDRWHKESL